MLEYENVRISKDMSPILLFSKNPHLMLFFSICNVLIKTAYRPLNRNVMLHNSFWKLKVPSSLEHEIKTCYLRVDLV